LFTVGVCVFEPERIPGPVHNNNEPVVVDDPLSVMVVLVQVNFAGLVFTVMFGNELSPSTCTVLVDVQPLGAETANV
jgi:hypothetical protein